MNRKSIFALTCVAALGVAGVVGSYAIADSAKVSKGAAQPEMKLPPGWTEADMQACMMAGMPGKMHAFLAQSVGEWSGKDTMWMAPDTEPMTSDCTSTVTSIMDGHFTKIDHKGEMPGMGPYNGLGINGFDNVTKKFNCTWIDNHSTGIMTGTGELSPDGKSITWKYTYNCPITKKPAIMKQVETNVDAKTKTLEMWGTEPKSGKEFKMMRIELTRK